jgi:hypothetical protein
VAAAEAAAGPPPSARRARAAARVAARPSPIRDWPPRHWQPRDWQLTISLKDIGVTVRVRLGVSLCHTAAVPKVGPGHSTSVLRVGGFKFTARASGKRGMIQVELE